MTYWKYKLLNGVHEINVQFLFYRDSEFLVFFFFLFFSVLNICIPDAHLFTYICIMPVISSVVKQLSLFPFFTFMENQKKNW